MSLLEIVKNVSESLLLPEVTQVIGNRDKNVRQIYQQILRGGDDLVQMKNAQGDGWSVLERAHEFNGVAGVTEYDLPEDFQRMTVNTAWQVDKYWRLRGSMSGKAWQQIRNRQASISYNVFRIRAGTGNVGTIGSGAGPNSVRKFTLEPAPGQTTPLVYEYVSYYWWISADGTTRKRVPDLDTDESLFGNRIHEYDGEWRWQSKNKLDFSSDLALFERFRDNAFADDVPIQPIELGHRRRDYYTNSDFADVEWCP